MILLSISIFSRCCINNAFPIMGYYGQCFGLYKIAATAASVKIMAIVFLYDFRVSQKEIFSFYFLINKALVNLMNCSGLIMFNVLSFHSSLAVHIVLYPFIFSALTRQINLSSFLLFTWCLSSTYFIANISLYKSHFIFFLESLKINLVFNTITFVLRQHLFMITSKFIIQSNI